MSLKILIADDEKEARELLRHYLQQSECDAQIVECADGKTTYDALQQVDADIIFLDIKMPELSGIEVLQKRKAAALPAIIFTTAYDNYALPAFDFEAVDYLLKPFESTRFEKALSKAIRYVDFVKVNKRTQYSNTLGIKIGSRTDLIPLNDILYFQAEGTYVQVITSSKTYLIPDAIYELESTLNPSQFQRIHRSVIINIAYIKSIHSLLNGDHQVILKNGKELRASRTYKDTIKWLQNPDKEKP